MVKAGSGVVTQGLADSAGVPAQVAADTLVIPLGDVAALERRSPRHGKDIAAAIIEPLPANNGLLQQSREFLQRLRELTRAHGSVLIFDEVITGFRFGYHGYDKLLGIEPDLTTLGKIVGGGLPVAAVLGRHELLAQLAPLGPGLPGRHHGGKSGVPRGGHRHAHGARRAAMPIGTSTCWASISMRRTHATRSRRRRNCRASGPSSGRTSTRRAALPVAASSISASAIKEYHRRYRGWLAHGVYLPPRRTRCASCRRLIPRRMSINCSTCWRSTPDAIPIPTMACGTCRARRARRDTVATASLVFWWTILLRGEMRNNETLEREVLGGAGELRTSSCAERLAGIAAHHDRRNVMLVGESTLLALMLSGSLVVLFLLAQRRKQQREDMEKLLQFTSHEFKTPVAGVKGLLQSLAHRQHSRRAARRAHPARPARMRPARASRRDHPRLPARHVARSARGGPSPSTRARFIDDLLAHRAQHRRAAARSRPRHRGRPCAGRSRRPARDPREPARQRAQVRRRQRAHRGQHARWTLAARHQRPGTRLRAGHRRKAVRSSQSRQRRRRDPWRRTGARHRAPAGAPHGRRHDRRTARGRGRARCSP